MPRSSLASVGIDVAERTEPLARPSSDVPFRILVAGDFTAGSGRNRRPTNIDRDNFDAVLKLFAPALRLGDMTLNFRELEDFHPDRLVERLPEPAVRTEEAPAQHASTAASEGAPANLSGADLLRQMMGEDVAPAALPRRSDWDRLIEDIVAPYGQPKPDPRAAQRAAQRDAVRSLQMRALLHHPKFQALEAAWRGLYFLTRRLETHEYLKASVMDLPQEELATPAGLLTLQRAAVEEGSGAFGGEPWAVIAGLYYFGPDDELALTQIAAIAHRAEAPFLAGVAPDVVGLTRVFGDLRRSTDARWVGLALPRFLLRLPYGKDTDAAETFAFEEMPSPPEHERYLWGHPAIALAYLLGSAYTREGWSLRPGVVSDLDNLPLHVYKQDGEAQLKPCAEVLLTEEAAETLLDRGLMPLASIKGTDRVKLVRFQSVADPAAPLAGKWK